MQSAKGTYYTKTNILVRKFKNALLVSQMQIRRYKRDNCTGLKSKGKPHQNLILYKVYVQTGRVHIGAYKFNLY